MSKLEGDAPDYCPVCGNGDIYYVIVLGCLGGDTVFGRANDIISAIPLMYKF